MLHTFSLQLLHHQSTLTQTLKQFSSSYNIHHIYFTQRCHSIITSYFTATQLFGLGYTKSYSSDNITPYITTQSILIITNITEQQIIELNEFIIPENFQKIYLITFTTNNQIEKQILKFLKWRKKIVMIKEVNLNFQRFLDNAYMVEKMNKKQDNQKQKINKVIDNNKCNKQHKILQSFRSFLLSYPKIYQYQLYYLQTPQKSTKNSSKNFIKTLYSQLQSSLQILRSHSSPSYTQTSSPRIKILLLDRQSLQDYLSPLTTSIYYGALCQQLKQFLHTSQKSQKLLTPYNFLQPKCKLYNTLFQKDLQQSAMYIKSLTNDKTILDENDKFQMNYFYKAKKIISELNQPSPLQIGFHVFIWKMMKNYVESIMDKCVLEQNVINRINQYAENYNNTMVFEQLDRLLKNNNTSKLSSQNNNNKQQPHKIPPQKPLTQQQYLKISMLIQLTSDLWYFKRSKLRSRISQEYKNKYMKFIENKKIKQIKTTKLNELEQKSQNERSDLYRHKPKIVDVCEKWLKQVLKINENNYQKIFTLPSKQHQFSCRGTFHKLCINNQLPINRDSKLIILFNDIMGYNQLVLLRRRIKKLTNKQVIIMSQSYCTTQEYMKYLMEQQQ